MTLSLPFRQWMAKAINDLRLSVLPVSVEYAELLTTIPRHHGDPLDRLIISQAKFEKIPVISADSQFDQYAVQRLW
jgi:PIN domain nuclease of toxin-antitoxin system